MSLEEKAVSGMTEKEQVEALDRLLQDTPQQIAQRYEYYKNYFHALVNKLGKSTDKTITQKIMDFDIKLRKAEDLAKKK